MNAKHLIVAVLVSCVATVSQTRGAPGGDELRSEVKELFELGKSPKTRAQAQAQYQQLRSIAPADARIPYAYAVILLKQHRHRDAASVLNEAFQLGSRDLCLWKTKIWLAVQEGRYVEALEDMAALCGRIPEKPVSGEVQEKCSDTASYLGQLCAYMAGPGEAKGNEVPGAALEYRVASVLPDPYRTLFEEGQRNVLDRYSVSTEEADALRSVAQDAEEHRRGLRLAHLAEDSGYAFGELEDIEGIRADVRAGAANERNTIAATRSRQAGRHSAAHRYDAARRHRSSYDRKTNPSWVFDPNSVNPRVALPFEPVVGEPTTPETARWDLRYGDQRRARVARDAVEAGRGAESGGYYGETGLDDTHYADVNRREKEESDRLALREKKMNRRLSRIAQDEADLLTRPIVGNTRQLMSLKAKATALATYVPLPLSPELAQERIVASFDPAQLSGEVKPGPMIAAR